MNNITRAEWEAQRHSNEPFPPWSIATQAERCIKLVFWIGGPIVVVAGFIAIMTVFGMMVETATQYKDDHDRCMKRATNGYEIERCR